MLLTHLEQFGQILTGIGALVIAFVAYFHGRRAQQLNAASLYISNWRDLNKLIIESDTARATRLAILDGGEVDNGVAAALVAIYINQALAAYYTWKYGGLPKKELAAEFRSIWAMISRSPWSQSHLETEGYPKEFVTMFTRARPFDE